MRIKDNLFLKRAKLFAKINECRMLKRHLPVIAYLLITSKCNLRCRYCFFYDQDSKELSTPDWIRLIDDLYKRGNKMICFLGGEPLLHPDIDILVSEAKDRGIICDMTTNAILIPKNIDIVKKFDSLMVSLDGDREANDVNRGKGTFDKIMEGIRVAREAGVVVRVNAVMNKHNRDSVDFLLDLADKYDLYITFNVLLAESMVGEDDYALSREEIKELYRKVKIAHIKGRRVLYSVPTLNYAINYPLPYNEIILQGDKKNSRYYTKKCPFGRTMFYVDSNGDFCPCATLWKGKGFKPKNYLTDSFERAWDNMAGLKCQACFCLGVPEWNRAMSFKGLVKGLGVTLQQAMTKRKANVAQ